MIPKGVQAQETGHNSMLERVKAFRELISALTGKMELAMDEDKSPFSPNATKFIMDWEDIVGDDEVVIDEIEVTAKQYVWAKDLYDKHCL